MRNWQKEKLNVRAPNGKNIILVIYVPENADLKFWRDIAVKYWTNALGGMHLHPSATTSKVESGCFGGSTYFFKLCYARNKRDYIKRQFRKSRARRDLIASLEARARGLHVPEVACIIEARNWGIKFSSVIITREVDHSIQLRQLLEKLNAEGNFRFRRRLVRALGREMAKWHLAGMRHGDAKGTNVLYIFPGKNAPDLRGREGFGTGPEDVPMNFCWLDNERSKPSYQKKDFIRNLVIMNLARSGVTLTDRMRFWTSYWALAGRIYHPMTQRDVLNRIMFGNRKQLKIRGIDVKKIHL